MSISSTFSGRAFAAPRFIIALSASALVSLAAGCGGGGGGGGTPSLSSSSLSATVPTTTVSRVVSVAIAPHQVIGVGQTLDVALATQDSTGVSATIPGSQASLTVVSGGDKVTISNGRLAGLAPGRAQVTATINGKTSAPQTVAVGTADIVLLTSGTRGNVPLTYQIGTGRAVYGVVAATAGQTTTADWLASYQVTAPDGYGDRQFSKWQRDGQDVGTSATLTFTPFDLPGVGPLTAVYTTRAASGVDSFAPNYSQPNFPHWKQFPVRIYFDSTATAASQAQVTKGIDRWVLASGGAISYTLVSSPAQADITVGFGSTASGLAGICDTTWNGLNEMTSAKITLNPPTTGLFQTTTQNLETIACHEFGHAFGLTGVDTNAGHSTDSSDTMYVTGNSQVGVITARDMNTMSNAYPTVFGAAVGRAARVGNAAQHFSGHQQ